MLQLESHNLNAWDDVAGNRTAQVASATKVSRHGLIAAPLMPLAALRFLRYREQDLILYQLMIEVLVLEIAYLTSGT